MPTRLDNLYDEAKKKSVALWDSLKNSGKEKFKETLQNLNEALPDVEAAGFELVRLDVDIALIPRMFARFRQVREISTEAKKEILEQTKKRKLLNLILMGLFKAVEIRSSVKIDHMDLKEIELEIGLTPSVKLIFRREQTINLIDKSG